MIDTATFLNSSPLLIPFPFFVCHSTVASKSSFLQHLHFTQSSTGTLTCSSMEDSKSIPCRKPHFPFPELNPVIHPKPIRQQGKSYMMQFLFKALFFAIFVMLLPLFPSQAPEFINHTMFTKFWELIHLVFIGIAVSYGLFSRRNVEKGFENDSNLGNSESYMPRIFPVSSHYDDGYEYPYGSGEKRVAENPNSQYFVSNPVTVFDAQCKPNLSVHENGVENSCGLKEKNVAQAWNSQYFQGEPMVFVAQPNYALDEWGKSRSIVDSEPLGLPIRSLKSRVRNPDCSDFFTRSESGLGSKASNSFESFGKIRNGFGDLAPINLEEKFNEAAAASPSPVHWRSNSERMGIGRRVGSATRPSHFRPLSVDESQFESLKARSFRSTLSFSSESSSQPSSMSSSPKRDDSFAGSMSSEVQNSKVENLKKRKSSQGSSPSGLPSPPKPVNEKASMSTLHSRGYSIGSFQEEALRRSSENYLKEFSRSGSQDDQLSNKEVGPGFWRSDMRPTSLTKSSSRGKSVRTIRASLPNSQNMIEKTCENGEASSMRKDMMQNGGTKKKNLENQLGFDSPLHMPKPAFFEYRKKEVQEFCGNAALDSEDDSESEAENFEVSSEDEDTAASAAAAGTCNSLNVARPDSDEVDKKASEFIAKFREQIRLQKVASMDRARGLGISKSCFR